MPGIVTLISSKDVKDLSDKLKNLVNLISIPESWNNQILLKLDGYSGYPVEVLNFKNWTIIIEGYIYNLSKLELKNTLERKLALSWSPESFQEWVKTLDGEFWIQGVSNDLYFSINDTLSRLPIYSCMEKDRVVLSRGIAYIAALNSHVSFDKLGVAQFLWSGYPIGERTLFKNIKRLTGNSLITIKLTGKSLTINEYTPICLNFDEKDNNLYSSKYYATALAEKFTESCKNISHAPLGVINLSLSGGQDSRAVAAGFYNQKIPFRASTYLSYSGSSHSDADISQKICSALNIPWKKYILKEPISRDKETILRIKNGMNYVGMSFIIDYLTQLSEELPPGSFYITGDGGDKALPDLRDYGIIKNIETLVNKLDIRHCLLSSNVAENLTGLALGEIKADIRRIIEKYPEQELKNKGVHFVIYERSRKAYFEGEDRTRSYFWATTPFYSLDFFKYAMRIPDNYKAGYRLYSDFQKVLSSELALIPDAGGMIVSSYGFYLKKNFQNWARSTSPIVKNTLRRLAGMPFQSLNLSDYEKSQILKSVESNHVLSELFEFNHLKIFLSKCNKEQYQHLETIISLVDNKILPML